MASHDRAVSSQGADVIRSHEGAEDDVLAYITVVATRRTKRWSTNPHERVFGKIERRTHVVAVFCNEAAVKRPIGAILIEHNDEWDCRAPKRHQLAN